MIYFTVMWGSIQPKLNSDMGRHRAFFWPQHTLPLHSVLVISFRGHCLSGRFIVLPTRPVNSHPLPPLNTQMGLFVVMMVTMKIAGSLGLHYNVSIIALARSTSVTKLNTVFFFYWPYVPINCRPRADFSCTQLAYYNRLSV